jgi:hypothetical protein
MGLQVKPELGLHAKEAAKAERRVGGYGAPAMHNLIDPAGGYANILGQAILGDTHRFQELGYQYLAGVDGRKVSFGHVVTSLMIINDFNIKGVIALPNEAEAPLFVDSDTVLAFPVMMQNFQMVGGRDAQGIENAGSMQHFQLDNRRALDGLG